MLLDWRTSAIPIATTKAARKGRRRCEAQAAFLHPPPVNSIMNQNPRSPRHSDVCGYLGVRLRSKRRASCPMSTPLVDRAKSALICSRLSVSFCDAKKCFRRHTQKWTTRYALHRISILPRRTCHDIPSVDSMFVSEFLCNEAVGIELAINNNKNQPCTDSGPDNGFGGCVKSSDLPRIGRWDRPQTQLHDMPVRHDTRMNSSLRTQETHDSPGMAKTNNGWLGWYLPDKDVGLACRCMVDLPVIVSNTT